MTRRLRLAAPSLATPRPREASRCGAHRLLLPAVGTRAGLTPLLPTPPPSLPPPPTTSKARKPDLQPVIPSITRRRPDRQTAPRAARPAPRPTQRSQPPAIETTPTSATRPVIPPAPEPRPALTLADRNPPGPGRLLIIVAVCVVLSAILFGPPRAAARVAAAVAERLRDRHPPDDGPG